MKLYWEDYAAMLGFMVAAYLFGCGPFSPLAGVAFWRLIAK